MCWTRTARAIVAVVSDGCGSGKHSEVGAKLGSRLYVEALSRRVLHGAALAHGALWRGAQVEVLARLRGLARSMGGDPATVVSDYFLFTLVGAIVTPELTAVFAVGDGLFALNGEITVLGPFPGNCPPYLGYSLLEERGRESARVEPLVYQPTADLDSLLLATDGALDLVPPDRGESEAAVGSLGEFWSCERLFANRDGVRRRLAVLNREVVDVDWERQRIARSPGRLADDTTIIAMRREATSERCDRDVSGAGRRS